MHYQTNRVEAMGVKDKDDIQGHDAYIKKMWLDTVKRGDHVYVVGDLILSNREYAVKMLHELKSTGCKIHLIVGNHDKATHNLTNLFESIDLIKVVEFKKERFPFLDEDFTCVLCHYPMKSWPQKCYGSANIYGHVHTNSPWIDEGDDLCLNVGLDTPLANYGLISLEQVYEWYKGKLNGIKPTEYADMKTKDNPAFVR